MSDADAEKQLLLDQLHIQFENAISYNLYTGLAYGAQDHHPPPSPLTSQWLYRDAFCRVLHLD
jgi:hypothetical protein